MVSPHGFATYAELNLDTHDPLQILTACGHLVQLGQLLIQKSALCFDCAWSLLHAFQGLHIAVFREQGCVSVCIFPVILFSIYNY